MRYRYNSWTNTDLQRLLQNILTRLTDKYGYIANGEYIKIKPEKWFLEDGDGI